MTVYEILNKIQVELKAPKNQFNAFGKYSYRSCEDILEAVKPLLCGSVITISDEIINVGNRFYVKATATITFDGQSISCAALAREEDSQKGMSASQLTGATSSYSRKYCLNGLLLIDDTKDADNTNKHEKDAPKPTSQEKAPKEEDVPLSPGEELTPEMPKKTGETISEAQGKRLYAMSKTSNIPTEGLKLFLKHYYNIEHSKDIPKAKYTEICGIVENTKKFDAMMMAIPT